jgi:ABC-type Mn2+/Zn2+ transport system permease subunit
LVGCFAVMRRMTLAADAISHIALPGIVVAILLHIHPLVSPEIAHTSGINVARLNLYFLLVFALTIALGLRYLGVLLVGSLVIIPAATAKRLAQSLHGMLLISIILSVASTTLGTCLSFALQRAPGSMIVLVAAGFFVLSLLRGVGRRTVGTGANASK